jgi:hypothetical protein
MGPGATPAAVFDDGRQSVCCGLSTTVITWALPNWFEIETRRDCVGPEKWLSA